MTEIDPDMPELRMFAQLIGVAPSRIAAAFNDPENFFEHMTIAELARFTESCDRLQALMVRIHAAQQIYLAHMEGRV